MASSREVYAKMSPSLDRNRKIRRGGRAAREVFLWVLRRVAERASDGTIPAADVLDYEYLADELMCGTDEAKEGVERAVAVGLIAIDGDRCAVLGWDDEWARRPMTGAERTANWKARAKSKGVTHDTKPPNDVSGDEHLGQGDDPTVTGDAAVTPAPSPVTPRSRGDTGDQGDQGEGGEREPASPPGRFLVESAQFKRERAAELASIGVAEINRVTGRNFDPKARGTLKLCAALAKAKHTPDEVLAVVRAKHTEWGHDARMVDRVCPDTLFALINFEKYLDAIKAGPPRLASPARQAVPARRAPLLPVIEPRTPPTPRCEEP